MKPKVYLETTIPSYLASRPSRDLQVAAHQQITYDRWTDHRHRFRLFVSERVVREAGSGNSEAVARRLAQIGDIPELEFTTGALDLATRFLSEGAMPQKSPEDAIHVAIATLKGMDYLPTWNCRHIVNAEIMKSLARIAEEGGYSLPVLCSPEQLRGH